ncbi:MAG: hypothetical protein AAF355_16260, partial [Myxococcota bacterium]
APPLARYGVTSKWAGFKPLGFSCFYPFLLICAEMQLEANHLFGLDVPCCSCGRQSPNQDIGMRPRLGG